MRTRAIATCICLLAFLVGPAVGAPKGAQSAKGVSIDSVNGAEWRAVSSTRDSSFLVRLQVMLDRAHASPGQIDATWGENTRKAVAAFRSMRGMKSGERIDADLWRTLTEGETEPALVTYAITDKDVNGPFIDNVPDDYRDKAGLKRLAYTSVEEMLGEKFHISEELLKRLNPRADFKSVGQEIIVANVEGGSLPDKLTRIEVDAARQQVRGYDKSDRVVVIYPATVGSGERPSPTGEFKVTAIAENPTYSYDPALNLRGVDVDEPLKLPPGPNNPVGVVWIDLSAKGYGIHGTPDPEAVSKKASHGCVRVTNWDALELAKLVTKGVAVTITGGVDAASRQARRG